MIIRKYSPNLCIFCGYHNLPPSSTMGSLHIPISCSLHECMFFSAGFACSIHDDGAFIRAYTSDKTSYYWGNYLAKSHSQFYKAPTLSPASGFSSKVLDMVAGPNHGLILTSDGEVSKFILISRNNYRLIAYNNLNLFNFVIFFNLCCFHNHF